MTSGFFTFKYEDHLDHVQSILLYFLCDFVDGELSTDGFDEYEKEYARLAEWYPVAELGSIMVASTYDWRELVKKVAGDENPRN